MDEPRNRDLQPFGGIARKPYSPPKLEIYGDLRQITQNKGTPSRTDAGKNKGTHTGHG